MITLALLGFGMLYIARDLAAGFDRSYNRVFTARVIAAYHLGGLVLLILAVLR